MAQVDTLRPISTRLSGAAIAVPSGGLYAVTSDDNDSTWISFPVSGFGANWSLRVEPHTPPAGHGRHRIRGRIRVRCDTGTVNEDIDVGRGAVSYYDYETVPVTTTVTEQYTSWFTNSDFNLGYAGEINDFNIGGGWWADAIGALVGRTTECYIDIDCRARPDYTPDVLDGAGTSKAGSTITDSKRPTFSFGGVSYDGLPSLSWSLSCGPFSTSGSGSPPSSVVSTADFPNDSYVATFVVSSTIRGVDTFSSTQSISFDVNVPIPVPPPPANVTVVEQSGGLLVSWENPGGQPWDDDYVIAEILRSDCDAAERRIAIVENGLTASYLDMSVPTTDNSGMCDAESCQITYRIRYWGTISSIIELPSTVPDGMIIGWPSTVASIPSGWTRVAALDGRYPVGSSTTVSGTTGGATTHTHTTTAHSHSVADHSHSLGGSTGSSNASTTSARFNGASQSQADQPHTHTRPGSTGSSGSFTTGSTAPNAAAGSNYPASYTVIWIESDGTPTAFPTGSVAFSVETVDGWSSNAATTSRFLRGADVGSDGGSSDGGSSHTHSIDTHSHTGGSHSHSISSTGLSDPLSSIEAGYGSSTPRWLPRHTHPMSSGSASTGSTSSDSGGVTSAASSEPLNKRVNVVHNTGGGLQTRVIGLFRGDITTAPATLTRCDSTDGTPDMRDWFARDRGSDSINSTGGGSTHSHTVASHTHTMAAHTHTTSVGVSTTSSFERPTFGDLGNSPTTDHTHSSGDTGSASPSVSTTVIGSTSTDSNVPPYETVHFVRLDGVSTEPIDIPQITTSEYAEITVSAPSVTSDRIVGGTSGTVIDVCPTRTYTLPRLSARAVQVDGGLPQVSSTAHGKHQSLTIPLPSGDVAALETVLSERRVWYAPLDEPADWYAPSGWQVSGAQAGVRVVSVNLIRDEPALPSSPEDLL